MARQDSYYPYRPNYATEVGMVYNPIDLSAANEIVAQQLGQRSQMYQQNLDAIAAAENEMESQKFRDVDRPGINVRLENFSKDIDDMVKNQYQGDYAMARKDILRKIAKERGEISRATQRYELEQKYLPIKQDLITKGKLVIPKGTLDPYNTPMYDEQGNYIPGTDDYSQMYERNDYDKWVKENISDRINNTISDNYEQTLAGADKGKNAFLVMLKRKGMDRNAFLNQVRQDADKYISDDDVKAFLSYNPTYAMEFGNDINAARNYLNTTTARHISEQVDRSLTANPYWKNKEVDGDGGDGGGGPLDISSDVIHNPWNYNRFRSNNKNVSSGTYVMGIGDAGKFDPIPKVYNSKTHNLEQYQAKIIEKRILNSSSTGVDKNGNPVTAYKYPELRNLYDLAEYVNSPNFEVEVVDGKVLPKLPRDAKFNNNGISVGGVSTALGVNFLGAAAKWGVDGAVTAAGLTAIPLTTLGFKGDTRVDSQKMANQVRQAFIKQVNSEYQSKLKDVSKEYFKENPTDFGVREYSPNIMDSKTRTNYSQFLEMFNKVFKPSNFEFQEGDYVSKSGEDIDKKYGGSDSKKVTFNPTAVSGNSETGLLFKVNQADGKMVNAKLKTSYHVQDEYLSKIMGIPSGTSHELRDALNGSAVDIDEKSGKITSAYNDMPLRNSYNFKAGVYDGTDIDDDAPRRVLLKENNEPITIEDIMAISKPEAIGKLENFYKGIYGNSYSINKPALMDKAMMFNILKSI